MNCYCGHSKSMHDSDGDERQEKFWCNGPDCDCGRFIPFRGLSEAQQKVLELRTDGKSIKQIAVALGMSYQTVKNHITNINKKRFADDYKPGDRQ